MGCGITRLAAIGAGIETASPTTLEFMLCTKAWLLLEGLDSGLYHKRKSQKMVVICCGF